jgi:predicted alpha-1,2-mannosidase
LKTNKLFSGTLLISVMLLILMSSGCTTKQKSNDGLAYVDPKIGGVGLLLQPTRPTVQVPNQMIRMYPVRNDFIDDQIRYFPLTLISHRLGELFGIMPFTGSNTSTPPVSAWDKELEKSTPYYLSTWLEDYDITVEFTPGNKAGFFRFTYPDKAVKNIFLKNVNKGDWKISDAGSVSGVESFNGMNAWVYGEFSEKGTFKGTSEGMSRGTFMTWANSSPATLEFKYAVSFISADQAQKNLAAEIPAWEFEKLRDSARLSWDKVINQIQVKGGSEKHLHTFYTALYRCYERMINITEGGEYYSNYDSTVHKSTRTFYVDDWTWDTYLAHHPLRAILDPAKEADMVQSYVDMYQQSGWLPTFPVLWGDNPCMNGFHSTIMILDAYRKGIRNFDINKAYEAMKKNSMEATMVPWRNGPSCSLDDFYREKGFFPALRPGEKETVSLVHSFEKRQSVAVTLGHSYDDWALANMAKELGKNDDYEFFMKKSYNYKNLYWPEKGFFMPKDNKGEWIDIDPKWDGGMGGRDYYDENNGWTYLWQVQHDLPGLISLMGGKQNFENRLDQLFREPLGRSKYQTYAKFPDFTGAVGQFCMGNEPSFHIPYLYNLTDSPWKTQQRIRMLLDTWYPDNIFGIPGDEDGGGMSAFVVFSSMGFYPLIPGLPVYTIGSPLFEEVKINLPNGKTFTVLAPGGTETNKFIQKAWLNGQPLDTPWFTHEALMNGGVLKLEMGPYPNMKWGRAGFNLQ